MGGAVCRELIDWLFISCRKLRFSFLEFILALEIWYDSLAMKEFYTFYSVVFKRGREINKIFTSVPKQIFCTAQQRGMEAHCNVGDDVDKETVTDSGYV